MREQKAKLAALRREMRRRRPVSRWRRRALVIILLLLLLLLLRPCEPAGPGAVPPPPPPRQTTTATIAKPPDPPKKKAPIVRRTKRRLRPEYEGATKRKKTWLDDFRMQVAGRSVRLAGCFEGVERPGAVRWVARVDPTTGKVADHSLEPVASSVAITKRQRECLVGVLSDPPYRLSADAPPPTPERVGLVLEF